MSIDISEYLPDYEPAPEEDSGEIDDPAEIDDSAEMGGGKQHGEKQIEIDEELGQLLPGGTQAERPQQPSESVRTTFCLSPDATRLFGRLSGRTGKSQKALLGDVLRLTQAALENSPERLRAAADQHEQRAAAGEVDTATKSMAIASKTRQGLNELSQEASLPRDHLVEIGIRLVKLSREEALRKKLGPHEEILGDLQALYGEIEEVQTTLTGARMENGSEEYDDPVEQALFDILGAVRVMAEAIEDAVESQTPIEETRQFT